MRIFSRSVWLSALGGEMRFVEPLAPAREIWIARPQRLVRDGAGRIVGADATGPASISRPALLLEWLYRPGMEEPDYCHALRPGETVPQLVPADWVRSPRNLVLLRPIPSTSFRRTA